MPKCAKIRSTVSTVANTDVCEIHLEAWFAPVEFEQATERVGLCDEGPVWCVPAIGLQIPAREGQDGRAELDQRVEQRSDHQCRRWRHVADDRDSVIRAADSRQVEWREDVE